MESIVFTEESPIIQARSGTAGIYIHYPFCIQKCNYCDFFSIGNGTSRKIEEDMIFPAYEKELHERWDTNPLWKEYSYDTIFLGGGTPSRMNPRLLEELLNLLTKKCRLESLAEISLEANPEDITRENLKLWRGMGINRINMGFQTSHEKYLRYVGRYYEPEIYQMAPRLLAESEFTHYGYDLIYGFPGQTIEEFILDLDVLTKWDPPHISLYSLTMEKGTEYSRKFREGKMDRPEEELQVRILQELPSIMKSRGWDWYEVSNYCKKGHHSRHNLKYWTMEPYLSLGPSAHGFDGVIRYANPRNWENYLKEPGRSNLDPSHTATELALGLFRLFYTIDMGSFLRKFPSLDSNSVEKLLNKWAEKGFAEFNNETKLFRWLETEAVLRLDDLILEFCEIF